MVYLLFARTGSCPLFYDFQSGRSPSPVPANFLLNAMWLSPGPAYRIRISACHDVHQAPGHLPSPTAFQSAGPKQWGLCSCILNLKMVSLEAKGLSPSRWGGGHSHTGFPQTYRYSSRYCGFIEIRNEPILGHNGSNTVRSSSKPRRPQSSA